MQIWSPDCQSCDLGFGGGAIPPPQQQSRAHMCSSQPLSPVPLLPLTPCNNQILRSYKSPHQLFLLFWWGCKLRGAKQSPPVVPRLGQSPRGAIHPKGMRLGSHLSWIQGIQLGVLQPRLPKAPIVGVEH